MKLRAWVVLYVLYLAIMISLDFVTGGSLWLVIPALVIGGWLGWVAPLGRRRVS